LLEVVVDAVAFAGDGDAGCSLLVCGCVEDFVGVGCGGEAVDCCGGNVLGRVRSAWS
jgi:hypothetical protein